MTSPAMDRSEKAFADGLRSERYAKLPPEALEQMGKEAATRFLEKGVALNDSIAKLAGAHDDISNEQVKRICEFANTAVYLARHDQAKTAGASSSYPQFPLADPARVIQDLNDGATPTVTTATDIAYSRAASKPVEKTASVKTSTAKDQAWAEVEKLFQVKTAAPEFTSESVVDDVFALKDSLLSTRDHLRWKGEQLSVMHKEAQDEYYELVKRHLLDGGSFTDVLAATQALPFDNEKVAGALNPVLLQILREKVASAQELAAATRGLEKVAHRVVNPEHPFVKTLGAIIDLDQEITKVAAALDEIEPELAKVQTFIRESFGARQAS